MSLAQRLGKTYSRVESSSPTRCSSKTEWVLRSGHERDRDRVNRALTDLVALDCVEVDHVAELEWALDRYGDGADWADMLHLIASKGHRAFATFDRELGKRAGSGTPVTVEVLK